MVDGCGIDQNFFPNPLKRYDFSLGHHTACPTCPSPLTPVTMATLPSRLICVSFNPCVPKYIRGLTFRASS